MGFRGYVEQREQARAWRAEAWTLAEIAEALHVSKSTVSLWVRDVEFVPKPRSRGNAAGRKPHRQHLAKVAEIEAMREWGREQIGDLSDRDLLIAGTALYIGEGAKRDGVVILANTDPALLRLFVTWLRRFFVIDESKLRVRLYLHEGLDLDAAVAFWAEITQIPPTQFHRPYRAPADSTLRSRKHVHGCASVVYASARTHRAILGLCTALLSSPSAFRGGAIGSARDC